MRCQYLKNVSALYGITSPSIRKKRKKRINYEQIEQIKLVVWLKSQNILFFHIPNGGKRNAIEGAKFKRMGVFPGVPDIFVPIPRSSHHGLFLELKRESGGTISQEQKYWLYILNEKGYKAIVCNGFDNAKTAISDYLSITG